MLKIAAIQLDSQDDKQENLRVAKEIITEAKADGASIVSLPEYFNFIGEAKDEKDNAEFEDGETTQFLSDLAKELNIYIHGGSILEKEEGEDKLYNTTYNFNPNGDLIAKYRKVHLFDVTISDGPSFKESATIKAGNEIVTTNMNDINVGMAICYDLRFPEMFRLMALNGAEVLMLPADFTLFTGRDHWEVLLRARAIENQAYVVAAGQIGVGPGFQSYGRSMIVDPWGTVIATAPDKVGYTSAAIDLDYIRNFRKEVPSLANRRPSVYNLEKAGK